MMVDLSKKTQDKSIMETKTAVAQAYFLVLVSQENQRILDSTYINMKEILEQSKSIQTNGFLDETDITGEPMYRRAQRGIGYLAQEASIFRKLTVEDNIKAILEFKDLSKEQQKDRLESLLDEF